MSMYNASVPLFINTLRGMEGWFDKAEAFAEARGFEVDTLLQARLAPDQFTLVRQIQTACDSAKFMGARLSGAEAPSHPDTETTFAELRARIQATVAFLSDITEDQFDGAADRWCRMSFMPEGLGLRGAHYLNEFAIPNFYFHVTTAYAILRHNGVELGKRDFITQLSMQPME